LKQCEDWLALAESESQSAKYTGLVQVHNPRWAEKFSSSPLAYHDALISLVEQLRAALAKLAKQFPSVDASMSEEDDDLDEDDEDDDDDGSIA
jgi:hypothetical protein